MSEKLPVVKEVGGEIEALPGDCEDELPLPASLDQLGEIEALPGDCEDELPLPASLDQLGGVKPKKNKNKILSGFIYKIYQIVLKWGL